MRTSLAVTLAVFLALPCAFVRGESGTEESRILEKLDEIGQRLNRIEEELREIHGALRRLPVGEKGFDVRQTPEYRAIEKRLQALQERLRENDRTSAEQIWKAMGDPEELARRLSKLAESFGPMISDPGRREEFKKDIEALREKIGEKVSEEELYKKMREKLCEGIERARNDREKEWLRRQLGELERSEGRERKELIAGYVRIGNVRATHELAQKYAIPREQMVECGLAFIGYRRTGGPPEHRERPGAPRGRGRGEPGPERSRESRPQ